MITRMKKGGLLILLLLLLLSSVQCAEIGKYFIKSPQSIVAPPGDRVTFQCETNPPSEQVRWKFNASFLSSNDSDVRINDSFLVVKVSKLKERYLQQVGDYQCVADFGAVSLTSLPAQLSIAELDPFPQHRSNQSLEVVEGNTISIACDPPFSNPPPIIQFWKDGRPLQEDVSSNVILRENGVLILQNVTTFESSGIYWCVVSNHITGENQIAPTYTKVSIIPKGKGTKKSPEFLMKPKQYFVIPKDANVTLDCVAIGNPPPTITWRRLRGSSSSQSQGGSLHLNSVSIPTEGEYVCEAYNGIGDALTSLSSIVLNSPPNITIPPDSFVVEEGQPLSIPCGVEGLPKPRVYWVFNGNLVTDIPMEQEDNSLMISEVEKKHAGLFQCFATNPMGSVYSPAEVRVVPKQYTKMRQQVVLPPTAILKEDLSPSSHEEDDSYHHLQLAHHLHNGNGHHKKLHHHHKRKKLQDMTPPSKPIVNRVSDSSVMVRWSVPLNGGYPIQFFKIQYRDVSKRGSRWNTIDDDIPPHIHSYEVQDLKQGHTYRFRIAAVYSNNDNKIGSTSDKFSMTKDPSLLHRRPNFAPVITNAIPYNNTAILLRWKMMKEGQGVDGFFIYYRESTSASEYQKVSVLGGDIESFYISFLKEATSYDIKIQAFNRAGASPFSSIIAAKTMGQSSTERPDHDDNYNKELHLPEDLPPPQHDHLYVLLGSLFIGFWVVICISCALCYKCKQRRAEEDAKYPPVVPASALSPDQVNNLDKPHVDFIPYHIPSITSALDEKETSFVERFTNNNHRPLSPGSLLNHSACDLSSFKSNNDTTELQLMTSRLRKETIVDVRNCSNSLHKKHKNHQQQNQNQNQNQNQLSMSSNNYNHNYNHNHSTSLRKLPYVTCSQDELDKDDEEDTKGSRIFPKEHYKVSRKQRSRRNLANIT